jgi:hypothetical protein
MTAYEDFVALGGNARVDGGGVRGRLGRRRLGFLSYREDIPYVN